MGLDDLRDDLNAEWAWHKENPAAVSVSTQQDDVAWRAQTEERPDRLTLGQLASQAGVPYGFAQEAAGQGLLRPDHQEGRVKRYRPKLASWLGKLYTLREAGLPWAEIGEWSKRRWQPWHEAERSWPVGYGPDTACRA